MNPSLRCCESVVDTQPPRLGEDIRYRTCNTLNPLPASSKRATGSPVVTTILYCSACGARLTYVTDFGNCDGIKKLKGFTKLLATQKRTIRLARRGLSAILAPTQGALYKLHFRRDKVLTGRLVAQRQQMRAEFWRVRQEVAS